MTTFDYSSFSAVAKRCFRDMARELGYEQHSGIAYSRLAGGWHEVFGLQASSGVEFFYVNVGIAVPDLCPVATPEKITDCGMLLGFRLRDVDDTGGFDRATKREVEDSAARVLTQHRAIARPWLDALGSWDAIAAEYLRVNPIEESRIGSHGTAYGEAFRSATYGYLLLKAGRTADAARWLREAERLFALPEYITRDGRIVHEKEPHARLQKPSPGDATQLAEVREVLAMLGVPA